MSVRVSVVRGRDACLMNSARARIGLSKASWYSVDSSAIIWHGFLALFDVRCLGFQRYQCEQESVKWNTPLASVRGTDRPMLDATTTWKLAIAPYLPRHELRACRAYRKLRPSDFGTVHTSKCVVHPLIGSGYAVIMHPGS